MTRKFEACHKVTEEWEGGWVNHRLDPGGATKWGITIRTLRSLGAALVDFNNDGRVTVADLRAMTPDQAREIYRRNYWRPIKGDELPLPLALAVYDMGVNAGVRRAAKALQRTVGASPDGQIGPRTLAAVRAKFNKAPRATLREFQVRRMLHWTGLTIFATFGRGWTRRLVDVTIRAVDFHTNGLPGRG